MGCMASCLMIRCHLIVNSNLRRFTASISKVRTFNFFFFLNSSGLFILTKLSVTKTMASSRKMSNFKLEQVTGPLGCGEGPHWDSARKCLYLVDIPNSLVLRYVPATKELFTAKVGKFF